ncbi:MAG: hypothetical protein EOM24_04110 [Chloroflexia bacterium]|nr:hypothetical protein [Chloroflexia bacterium]
MGARAGPVARAAAGLTGRDRDHLVGARLRLARSVVARRAPTHLLHLVALGGVAGLARLGLAPWLSVAAFTLLALRAWLGLLPRSLTTPTTRVDVQALSFSLLTVAAIALGSWR